MSFLDRAKETASQAAAAAQQAASQGQAKFDEMQARRQADAVLRELGAAFYAEQRGGGSRDLVNAALAAVDRYANGHGVADLRPRGGR